MAKCDFAGGIKNVRGTLSKTIFFDHGKKVTRRVVAKVYNGKQRVYINQTYERRSAPSANEVAARARFAQVNRQLNALTEEQKKEYAREWKAAGYKFNGKKYNTLRGYIVGRLYAAELLD